MFGNVMDTAGALRPGAAASGGITPSFDPDLQKNREQSTEAMDKLKQDGVGAGAPTANRLTSSALIFAPDPLTSGTA